MPITTETVDSSGEILHLKGLDISDFLSGNAWANWEHNNDLAENIVGKFVYAKKIFSKSDCENERQEMFWEKMQTPFLYGVCELMDGEMHPGAVAIAAMIRYFKNRKEPVKVGASIEGQTLERQDGDLLRTVGRRVAITLRPCNKQCWVDFMGESEDSDKFLKSSFDGKSVEHTVEIDSAILEDGFPGDTIGQLKKALADLNKTLTAGGYNVAPGALVGGAALQVEDRGLRNRAKAAYRDWNRTRPLREVIKAALPEVSDEYVDHFVHLAHDLSLKKGEDPNLIRVGGDHSVGNHDADQKKLIEGLYWDPAKGYMPNHENFTSEVKKLRNDAGKNVFAKIDAFNQKNNSHHHAQTYYRLAKDFYGMGDHVPTTAAVAHPKINNGEPFQAQEFLDGGNSPLTHGQSFAKVAQKGREDGSLHKLAMMDMINGVLDRHIGNVMVHDGKVKNIDNDYSFTNDGSEPFYLDSTGSFEGIGQDAPHVDVARWVQSLSPQELVRQASAHGINRGGVEGMAMRLGALKQMSKAGMTFRAMADKLKSMGYMV